MLAPLTAGRSKAGHTGPAGPLRAAATDAHLSRPAPAAPGGAPAGEVHHGTRTREGVPPRPRPGPRLAPEEAAAGIPDDPVRSGIRRGECWAALHQWYAHTLLACIRPAGMLNSSFPHSRWLRPDHEE